MDSKKLSEILGDTELIPITLAGKGLIHSNSENIGLILPVHIWGIPFRVIDFLNRLETDFTKYWPFCLLSLQAFGQRQLPSLLMYRRR